MKGIVPRPNPVVIHFRVVTANCGVSRAKAIRDPAQIRLIVNPGMMTEARAWKRTQYLGYLTQKKYF